MGNMTRTPLITWVWLAFALATVATHSDPAYTLGAIAIAMIHLEGHRTRFFLGGHAAIPAYGSPRASLSPDRADGAPGGGAAAPTSEKGR